MLSDRYIEKCTGCNACVAACPKNAISLKVNNEGFWYPDINASKCIDCGICDNVCDFCSTPNVLKQDVYAGWNADEEVRMQSSSGGIFSMLAEVVLNSGGAVIGAAWTEQNEVKHILIEDINELYKLRGSKYVQSYIAPDLYVEVKKLLVEGRRVMFSGTPCQIGGLKGYLRKDYSNLYTVDIVCHGVPSPGAWQKYLNVAENQSDEIKSVNMRDKSLGGWKKYDICIERNDGVYRNRFVDDIWGKAFVKNLFLRKSCYECRYKGENRFADVSLGDYWGVAEKWDDNRGTSLLIVNTDKGRKLIDSIKDKLELHNSTMADANAGNYALYRSSEYNKNRDSAFEKLKHTNFKEVVLKYTKVSFLRRVLRKAKKIFIR